MFRSITRYRLCDLFGIPLYLDFSLIILLLFFVLGDGSFYSGIVSAVILLVSITAHELGHALTARAFGYQTRDITLSLLGGCASLIALPRKAWQEFLTAVAGPAVSFVLAVLGYVAVSLISDPYSVWVGVFGYLFWINLMLGIFNLLPGFPMDGGRVFRSVMTPIVGRVKATYVAMILGRIVAVGIGLRGVWTIFHGGNWGFVSLMIAWMIWQEGYREYRLAQMESSWGFEDYRARVSPPPYGGKSDECDISRND